MTGYLHAIKAEGVNTLKNFSIDASLLSAANWVGDRYVASIVSISSPFAGTTTSLVVNGVDLLGKVLSTRYKNNGLLVSALRIALTSASCIGSVVVIPNLAGSVGIEISREVILRYTGTAAVVLFIKNMVQLAIHKYRFSELNINYEKLTVDEVNDPEKYSDDLIVKLAQLIREKRGTQISSEVSDAIRNRAWLIKNKPENINWGELTSDDITNFSDAKILAINAYLTADFLMFGFDNGIIIKINVDVRRNIRERVKAAEKKPENVNYLDYKELKVEAVTWMDSEMIFAMDTFLSSGSPLSQEKLEYLQDDVLKVIKDRVAVIKRHPDKVNYKELTAEDLVNFHNSEILALDAFLSANTPIANEKRTELKPEVLKAISNRTAEIRKANEAFFRALDECYK